MKIFLTGYGERPHDAETKPFRSMRAEFDLGDTDSDFRSFVNFGKYRRTSICLSGRTRKVNKRSSNNPVRLHIHDLSDEDALVLAKELVRYSMDRIRPFPEPFEEHKGIKITNQMGKLRSSLLDELFFSNYPKDYKTHEENRAIIHSHTVPQSEFLQVISYVESYSERMLRRHQITLKNAPEGEYRDKYIKKMEKEKRKLGILRTLKSFYEDDDRETEKGLHVVK